MLLSTAPSTFADFRDYPCQSLEGVDSLAKGTILMELMEARRIILTQGESLD